MKSTKELENILKDEKGLETLLNEIHNYNFTQYFYYLIDKYHLTKADVVNQSGLDKSYAYKIIEGKKGNHSKDKIYRLALAMKVSLNEANNMLSLMNAGMLYMQNARDLILINGLIKKDSVINVNIILEEHHMPTLE